jgi:excinuclease UvrABC helicase subunit UvrB
MKKNINLIKLFKLYNNRPNHLIKYLMEKNAFRESFLKSLIKIKNFKENKPEDFVFTSIDEMNDYFDVFNDDEIKKDKIKTIEELELKKQEYISNENYIEAANIRDYIEKLKNKNKL